MSFNTFTNTVSRNQIKDLLKWFHTIDEYSDDRPDLYTKQPSWNNDNNWPKHIIKNIIDKCLSYPYEVEQIFFFQSKTNTFTIHVDTGDGNLDKIDKNILIPLDFSGQGTTVIFDNKWFGPSTRFSKKEISPFSYKLPLKDGSFKEVNDITKITNIEDFDITQQQLDDLIRVRSLSTGNAAPDKNRSGGYNKIENYDPNLKFDTSIHKKYLNHIDIENLNGLKIKQIYSWKLGDVAVWDRQYIHTAGNTHDQKIGVAIFTNRVI